MIDVIYQKKFLKVNQIWYPGKRTVESLLKEKRKADILFVHGAPIEETNGSFRGWQEYHTCRNDLTISEEDMLANINKATSSAAVKRIILRLPFIQKKISRKIHS